MHEHTTYDVHREYRYTHTPREGCIRKKVNNNKNSYFKKFIECGISTNLWKLHIISRIKPILY